MKTLNWSNQFGIEVLNRDMVTNYSEIQACPLEIEIMVEPTWNSFLNTGLHNIFNYKRNLIKCGAFWFMVFEVH